MEKEEAEEMKKEMCERGRKKTLRWSPLVGDMARSVRSCPRRRRRRWRTACSCGREGNVQTTGKKSAASKAAPPRLNFGIYRTKIVV